MLLDKKIGWVLQGIILDMAKEKGFKPFNHDDLDLKHNLIDYARTLSKKNQPDAQLACAMIYASFAEYMAGHILDTLRHLVYQTTFREFAGIIYLDQRKQPKTRTMGKTLIHLQDFSFPDKEAVLKLFRDVSNSRNNLFHNFAKADKKGLAVLEDDIGIIKEKTEELFEKIDTIYIGLQKILLPEEPATDIS